MALAPEEVRDTTFRRRWRGYDRSQVDERLGRVATDYGAAIARIAALAEERSEAQAQRDALRRDIDQVTRSAQEIAERGRRDAERDADAVHARAEQAAALIVRQAEEAAAALTRQAEALREAAQADADAARRRVTEAEHRAREVEDAARERADALRVETERGWERLREAERRTGEQIRDADRALAGLRSKIGLLDQVEHLTELLAAIRDRDRPESPDPGVRSA